MRQVGSPKSSIAYGLGLRSGEAMMLRVSDIDSRRMLIGDDAGGNTTGLRPSRQAAAPIECPGRACEEGTAE
jgi:integrase